MSKSLFMTGQIVCRPTIATQRPYLKDARLMKMAPVDVTTYEIGTYVKMDPSLHSGIGKPSGKSLLRDYWVHVTWPSTNRTLNDKYSCHNLVVGGVIVRMTEALRHSSSSPICVWRDIGKWHLPKKMIMICWNSEASERFTRTDSASYIFDHKYVEAIDSQEVQWDLLYEIYLRK